MSFYRTTVNGLTTLVIDRGSFVVDSHTRMSGSALGLDQERFFSLEQ